jgi:hypothetical protein
MINKLSGEIYQPFDDDLKYQGSFERNEFSKTIDQINYLYPDDGSLCWSNYIGPNSYSQYLRLKRYFLQADVCPEQRRSKHLQKEN